MSDPRAIVSRWVRCPLCGGTGERLATAVGCTRTDQACRNWDKRAREAWAAAGYPAPGEVGRDEGSAVWTAYGSDGAQVMVYGAMP